MSETPEAADSVPPEPTPPPRDAAKAERARRLAQALRDNLRRRKTAPRTAPRPAN